MEALDIWDVAFPEPPENFRKEEQMLVTEAGGVFGDMRGIQTST